MSAPVCYCDRYAFPHRSGSGQCAGLGFCPACRSGDVIEIEIGHAETAYGADCLDVRAECRECGGAVQA